MPRFVETVTRALSPARVALHATALDSHECQHPDCHRITRDRAAGLLLVEPINGDPFVVQLSPGRASGVVHVVTSYPANSGTNAMRAV